MKEFKNYFNKANNLVESKEKEIKVKNTKEVDLIIEVLRLLEIGYKIEAGDLYFKNVKVSVK